MEIETVPNEKTISEFEAGKLTQAITNLTEQFRSFSDGVGEKFDKINEKLNTMAETYPTRREYDQLKQDVDGLAESTRVLQDHAAESKTTNKILWIIITALIITGLAAGGIVISSTGIGHGITH